MPDLSSLDSTSSSDPSGMSSDGLSGLAGGISSTTCMWTCEFKQDSKNVLEYLPVNLLARDQPYDVSQLKNEQDVDVGVEYIRQLKERENKRIALWKCIQQVPAHRKAIQLKMEEMNKIVSEEITFCISKMMCDKPDRKQHAHGGFPDCVDEKTRSKIQDELKECMRNLCSLRSEEIQMEMKQKQIDLPRWYICEVITKARHFLDAVAMYLQVQPEMQEFACAELFAQFASVAGINFRNAGCVRDRNMIVMGTSVTSKTSLRAYSAFITQPQNSKEGHNVQGNWLSEPLKTAAIAKVTKNAPPEDKINFERLDQLSGQLLGEMLLEMKHSALEDTVVGFAVQGTEVNVFILSVAKDTMEYIKKPDANERAKVTGRKDVCLGELDWSIPMDIMHPSDRAELWKVLVSLAAITSQI